MGMLLVSSVVTVALVTVLSGIGIGEHSGMGSGGVYSMIASVLGGQMGGTIGLLYVFGQVRPPAQGLCRCLCPPAIFASPSLTYLVCHMFQRSRPGPKGPSVAEPSRSPEPGSLVPGLLSPNSCFLGSWLDHGHAAVFPTEVCIPQLWPKWQPCGLGAEERPFCVPRDFTRSRPFPMEQLLADTSDALDGLVALQGGGQPCVVLKRRIPMRSHLVSMDESTLEASKPF